MRMLSQLGRVLPKRLAVALLVTGGLVALAAVPAATRTAACACGVGAATASRPTQRSHAPAEDADIVARLTSGIDLEVRVLNLRIEFPWMKALPITPGHRVLITMLTSDPESRR